ncbi:MAG: hypothetical protein ACPGC9_02535, partial [Cytophagales bacterium]
MIFTIRKRLSYLFFGLILSIAGVSASTIQPPTVVQGIKKALIELKQWQQEFNDLKRQGGNPMLIRQQYALRECKFLNKYFQRIDDKKNPPRNFNLLKDFNLLYPKEQVWIGYCYQYLKMTFYQEFDPWV